ncbi:MAG: sialic acid TRAP transporter substrate-binding protein SiaP [Firmicutes bacterium]|jgi:tripartite ATP-independent transporter DctP family solute receptor|nr:sialic acid TRAP transporter substrate-binding protein SiaP [Bacillota bacterium]MDH7496140.1 sialic acid TRAP transporter substrate-binding protein SiaP [Bacillota bacterium]
MKILKLVTAVLILAVVFPIAVDAQNAPKFTLKFATVASPAQPQTKAMYKFAEVVSELSGGNIKVDVFHSGQLADQKTQVLGTMRGSIDMCDASPTWFGDIVPYPEITVLEAAYAYRDLNHLYQVVNGPIGKKYWEELRKRSGLVVLDTWYLGTRQLNLRKSVGPVKTPADMKNVKLRMPGSEAWMDVGRGLGANPTPLGFNEVYLALKTGTIDGQDNPLPTDDANKFYEVTHYIVLTDHQMTIINPTINEKVWNKMPAEYKEYMLRALEVARNYCNQMVLEEEAKLLSKFQNQYGMEIIIPDKEAFMENMKQVYKKNEKIWGPGTYEMIQNVGKELYKAN